MRRVVGLTTAALLGFSMLAGPSNAAPKQQSVEGDIAMMAPFYGDQLATCYSGAHRRASVLSGGAVNGIVGFEFDVDPATIGKPFVLEVTGGHGDVDLDITYYTEFGTTEQALDRTHAPPNYSFEERGAGGESGIIPKSAGLKWTKAIVCMHTGADATFTYTAGKGVKLP